MDHRGPMPSAPDPAPRPGGAGQHAAQDRPLDLPLVWAGPILRRATPERVALWLAVSRPCRVRVSFAAEGMTGIDLERDVGDQGCRCLAAGERLYYLLIDLALDAPLPLDTWIDYRVALRPADGGAWDDVTADDPALCYPGRPSPGFVLPARLGAVLHGSCRKPHHPRGEGLRQADGLLARLLEQATAASEVPDPGRAGDADLPAWPSALVLTGDQVYADDVAGPMLRAIHALIARLGLPNESLPGVAAGGVGDAAALYRHPAAYYRRETLLPRHKRNYALVEVVFGGVEKPVFTTDSAHNHLVTLAEVLAAYLLSWSPVPWRVVEVDPPQGLDAETRALFERERAAIDDFVEGLSAVRRLFAHLPVAMIFDDHDISDDWNLSREWEEVAYGHPFSKRIIGNALLAYLVNQGWGNRPEAFDDDLLAGLQQGLDAPGGDAHDACIERLLRFDGWHYQWPTSPPLVVIDSRTHRWRSEKSARRPSGLMDWESLTELQHVLLGREAVVLVSPAPVFGVKLIEVIQRLFTWFGRPLMVDAENWMAHPGAAQTILDIFRHPDTPRHFVILSGDVHYSFVYDVELRGHERGPDIWQICSSGLRNAFPERLLAVLDHANRWLYSPRSPLNWFTRRRGMRVTPRKPEGTPHGRRLLNRCGIGLVEIDVDGTPWRIRELLDDGSLVPFSRREGETRWR
jgi:hypothetical protein